MCPSAKVNATSDLQVDGELEVTLRDNSVFIRTISGRDAYDDGSECNEPLPTRGWQGFGFEVRERRGDIRLIAEPSLRNSHVAVVRIRDSAGGIGATITGSRGRSPLHRYTGVKAGGQAGVRI